MRRKQQTLANEAVVEGVGLHTGVETKAVFGPAEPDTGVVFELERDGVVVEIPVSAENATTGRHRTVLFTGDGEDRVEINTTEHLLAALSGLGVDNARVRLSACEPPSGDGSALRYVEALQEAGVVEQDARLEPFVLKETVSVSDGKGAYVVAMPDDAGLRLCYAVDYPESRLARGVFEAEITPETFAAEVAPARTFCPEQHVGPMREMGCGKGASHENTLVLRGDEVVDNELRFENECARHKTLDLLGDLAVLGRPLQMRVAAIRSGHALNRELARELAKRIRAADHPRGLLDIREITKILPHRYPFLLVDRIVEIEDGKSITGVKNVTRNEEFFNGHFPGQPVMPGVLQVEALAQTGGVLMMRMADDSEKKLAVLMSIDGIKYRRPVVPGDRLVMHVEFEKRSGRIGQVHAVARVDGDIATEAHIKFALVDAESYT